MSVSEEKQIRYWCAMTRSFFQLQRQKPLGQRLMLGSIELYVVGFAPFCFSPLGCRLVSGEIDVSGIVREMQEMFQ